MFNRVRSSYIYTPIIRWLVIATLSRQLVEYAQRAPSITLLRHPRRESLFLPLLRHELHVSADDGVHGAERRGVPPQLQFAHQRDLGGWERELEDQLAEFRGEGEEGGWGVVVGC